MELEQQTFILIRPIHELSLDHWQVVHELSFDRIDSLTLDNLPAVVKGQVGSLGSLWDVSN